MPTRYRDEDDDGISEGRYMSSVEIASRRGLLGNAVAAKALLYKSAEIRDLLFFLQGLSLSRGGIQAVANDVLAFYHSMPSPKIDLKTEIDPSLESGRGSKREAIYHNLLFKQISEDDALAITLSHFLTRLCLDPALDLELPIYDQGGLVDCLYDDESGHSKAPPIQSYAGTLGILHAFKQAFEGKPSEEFVPTSISADMHETLEFALRDGKMVVVEGIAGVGKSTSAKDWALRRLGKVRYVTLSGITHRTGFFQRIAAAIGIASCQRKSFELQSKIEDFFSSTGLMLVIDEAHHAWPQAQRVYSNPEIIDWIDTALANEGVPVALLCTNQFARLKARVEKQTGWTSEQFMHRVRRYRKLPERPLREDLQKMADFFLRFEMADDGVWMPSKAEADREAVKAAVDYSTAAKLPLAAMRSAVDEARFQALQRGGKRVSVLDVIRALRGYLMNSDTALHEAFDAKPKRKAAARVSSTSVEREAPKSHNRLSDLSPSDSRPRFQISTETPLIDHTAPIS